MSQSTDIRQGTIIRIVDDDEDIRDALSFMLECKGWQVRTYGSARDFLTQDSPSIPGCLLLDIRMPDMSGVQLQSLMKEQRIHLPIIFITGHADVETAVATLKAGALDFLQKPVNTIALIEAIEPAVRISLAHCCGQLSPEKVTEVLLEMSPREKEITQLLLLAFPTKRLQSACRFRSVPCMVIATTCTESCAYTTCMTFCNVCAALIFRCCPDRIFFRKKRSDPTLSSSIALVFRYCKMELRILRKSKSEPTDHSPGLGVGPAAVA